MKTHVTIATFKDPDGGWCAYVPVVSIPHCYGRSETEAVSRMRERIHSLVGKYGSIPLSLWNVRYKNYELTTESAPS